MKLIMENWRRFLKSKVFGTDKIKVRNPKIQNIIDKLLQTEGLYILIEKVNDNLCVIKYQQEKGQALLGMIRIHKAKIYTGECLDSWVVKVSKAKSGWGPLLYEVAMEWSSMRTNGTGLTPDREVVSADARKIWDVYYSRSDIKKLQLDSHPRFDDLDQITPNNPKDDCSQFMSTRMAGDKNWMKSPLSKVYSKKPEVINKLTSINKIKIT